VLVVALARQTDGFGAEELLTAEAFECRYSYARARLMAYCRFAGC
jgi:hypothetical protein